MMTGGDDGYVLDSFSTLSIPHYTIYIQGRKEPTLSTSIHRDIGMAELSRCRVFFKAVTGTDFQPKQRSCTSVNVCRNWGYLNSRASLNHIYEATSFTYP